MPDNGSLAQQQARLVAALVGGAPLPADFDQRRAEVVAGILRAKRRKALLHAAPDLPNVLGAGWRDEFDRYATATVVVTNATSLDDGVAFCRWCVRNSGRTWACVGMLMRLRWRRLVTRARRSDRALTTEGTPSSFLRDESETRMM